ncbi:L,D-transpeptidase [Glacieibacterium frigidum]|nr:L,D-transpeptidase [Glacieibacterium frigidum]
MSPEARRVVDWVVASRDNGGNAFIVVDKANARLMLFDASGMVRATTPVLLGLARGDDSPPGIGTRKLSAIAPAERITPAGRFVLEAGKNMAGKDIVWIDYDAAVSLHRASDRKPGMGARSRVERLGSTTAAEKRVSLGCVNVATAFYDSFIQPTFGHAPGIAYILPETRSAAAEFAIPPV